VVYHGRFPRQISLIAKLRLLGPPSSLVIFLLPNMRKVTMELLNPIFILVLLTFIVGFSLGISRFISVKKGHLDRRYFQLMSGYTPPSYSKKLERNFSNLLELPLLFYMLAILCAVLNINSPLLITLAWLFVSLRIIHSAIHVSYNFPWHRFYAFLASTLVLLAMWIELFLLSR